jgi:F0F1-type ATP synthase membrane subunit b/b'
MVNMNLSSINWKLAGALVLVSFLTFMAYDATQGAYDKAKLEKAGWKKKV